MERRIDAARLNAAEPNNVKPQFSRAILPEEFPVTPRRSGAPGASGTPVAGTTSECSSRQVAFARHTRRENLGLPQKLAAALLFAVSRRREGSKRQFQNQLEFTRVFRARDGTEIGCPKNATRKVEVGMIQGVVSIRAEEKPRGFAYADFSLNG
jgi:hypothetical protein